ncbi:hypothetical protein [Gracilimonas sediminicola]|uniref:Uncharacterized protein n=1 Tax=Gracilimonas sediminicola TaxID=2952158 RepID=A0A9X2RCK3_9BACT|nr:hypothetical protein [Gracilimonas sediminicola]MCP9290022.1 hypothetical protein [Gracilimonas sediminicola]
MQKLETSLQETSKNDSIISKRSTKFNDHYTREQLLAYRSEGVTVSPDPELIKNCYDLHEYLGALGSLPTHANEDQEVADQREYLANWIRFIFVENDRSPVNIPIGFLMAEFSNGLISGNFERKGNNVAAFAEAYKSAIPVLVKKWQQHNKPKDTTPKLPESEADRLCKGDIDKGWPDSVLLQQRDDMDMIYGEDKPEGINTYYQRVKDEIEKRGL